MKNENQLDYDETIVIPSVIGLNLPFNIVTPSIRTNSTEIFEIKDTRKNLVEEIHHSFFVDAKILGI